ncbi:MAG: hypothetical protein WKF78_04645 [Candidatus Limnocylindrales bacterium]
MIVSPSAAAPSSSWSVTPSDPGLTLAPGRGRPPPDRRWVEPDPERQSGQDDELVHRVVTLHVTARIGLRVTQFLGIDQHVRIRPAILRHLGQDVVRRPVDDAAHPLHDVAGQVRRERRQDRDATGNGGLESQDGPRLPSRGLEFRTVMGEDVLVRGDDRLAGPQRRRDQGPGRLVAAHDFDDHIHVRVGNEMGRRVGQQVTRKLALAIRPEVPDRDARQEQRRTVGGRQSFTSGLQRFDDGETDGARPEQPDAQRRSTHDGTA